MIKILDFLFPDFACLACRGEKRDDDPLCEKCKGEIVINTRPVNMREFDVMQYYDNGYAPFEYAGPVVKIVLALKYGSVADAAEFLGAHMTEAIKEVVADGDFILVPVPLSKSRQRMREYNQAMLLAHVISKITGVEVQDVLVRTRKTKVQKQISSKQRADNLKDAFIVKDTDAIKNKNVIIIDDVFTSGATTNECARTIKMAGARSIQVLVASRV